MSLQLQPTTSRALFGRCAGASASRPDKRGPDKAAPTSSSISACCLPRPLPSRAHRMSPTTPCTLDWPLHRSACISARHHAFRQSLLARSTRASKPTATLTQSVSPRLARSTTTGRRAGAQPRVPERQRRPHPPTSPNHAHYLRPLPLVHCHLSVPNFIVGQLLPPSFVLPLFCRR
jgi:hypothetical protein